MNGIDPTRTVERLAERLRAAGASHPVAGAVSLAARGHARLDVGAWADLVELPATDVAAAEAGSVPFGELPGPIGRRADAIGLDLLSLADLERTWRSVPPIDVCPSTGRGRAR
jgi:hypothetical protein